MKNGYIYEAPVYCGAMKVFRVLNINTGTVYSSNYESLEDAINSIENGEKRAGKIVEGVTLEKIVGLLNLKVR